MVILKEFDHSRDYSQQLDYLHTIYTHQPTLLHVEYGYVVPVTTTTIGTTIGTIGTNVVDNRSIMITRIGNRLNTTTLTRFGITFNDVFTQVRQGLNELHAIGFAHCDVRYPLTMCWSMKLESCFWVTWSTLLSSTALRLIQQDFFMALLMALWQLL
jgi:hypothetical protein